MLVLTLRLGVNIILILSNASPSVGLFLHDILHSSTALWGTRGTPPPQDMLTPGHTHLPWKGPGTRDTQPCQKGHATRDTPPWTDRRLWKYYLPATSFAGGKNPVFRSQLTIGRRLELQIPLLLLRLILFWNSFFISACGIKLGNWTADKTYFKSNSVHFSYWSVWVTALLFDKGKNLSTKMWVRKDKKEANFVLYFSNLFFYQ